MGGVYRQRHPEKTVLYRVLFHYFERFVSEYEPRFEKEYGYFRPVVKEVVEKYLDCANPKNGFARVKCSNKKCGAEFLLTLSCKTRGFCPSCHTRRLEEWGEWVREEVYLDAGHRQVVFTIPKMLRIFLKYKRKLLGDLCRCAVRALLHYFHATKGKELMPGIIAVIQTYGLYASAHRGKIRKAGREGKNIRVVEEDTRKAPGKGWAQMIAKIYEVDPLTCRECGAEMRVIAFITECSVVDKIINHLKLDFTAARPPPPSLLFS